MIFSMTHFAILFNVSLSDYISNASIQRNCFVVPSAIDDSSAIAYPDVIARWNCQPFCIMHCFYSFQCLPLPNCARMILPAFSSAFTQLFCLFEGPFLLAPPVIKPVPLLTRCFLSPYWDFPYLSHSMKFGGKFLPVDGLPDCILPPSHALFLGPSIFEVCVTFQTFQYLRELANWLSLQCSR